MYRIILDGEIILQSQSPRWVKINPSSGAWIQCDYQDAECLAINGKRYSIEGRPKVDDAPLVVTVKYIDSAENMLATEKDVGLIFFALNNIIDDLNKRLGD